MFNLFTLLITICGTLLSFAAILTQFIGAQADTLKTLAIIQIASLILAVFLALIIYLRLPNQHNENVTKAVFTSMPGWLIFVLVLMIITALLGDLSVLLVRLTGHQLTSLFHLPSVCIVVFCLIYALLYFDFTQRKLSRFDKSA